MTIVNLQPIIEANDLDDLASRIATNFATLEGMLPTAVVTTLGRWPGVPVSFAFTFTHADLSAATNGAHQNLPLLTVPAGCMVERVRAKHTVAFAGGGATSVTLQIGDGSTADRYASALSISQTVAAGAMVVADPLEMPLAAATALFARVTPDAGHNLQALTAGSVTVVITLSKAS